MSLRTAVSHLLLPAFLGVLVGCGAPPPAEAPPREPVDLSQDWTLTPPGSVGVDEAALSSALDHRALAGHRRRGGHPGGGHPRLDRRFDRPRGALIFD